MQTRANAAIVVLLVLLSGAAVAVPAQDSDALATVDPSIDAVKDVLGKNGDAGFSLQMDADGVLGILKAISDLGAGSDIEIGDDLEELWEYIENTRNPTLEGLLNAVQDDFIWTSADFDGAVAAMITSTTVSDGHVYTIKAVGTVGGDLSGRPDDAPSAGFVSAKVSATVSAKAEIVTDSNFVFRSMTTSADYYLSAEVSRNIEEAADGYRIIDKVSQSCVFAGSADAMVIIDGLTQADMDDLMEGSDDIVKGVTVIARVSDGSGAFSGVEKRATMELDEIADILEDIPGLPEIDDIDDILEKLFGTGSVRNSYSATTTGADIPSGSMIEAYLSLLFGDSLKYYCNFPGYTNTENRDAIVALFGAVPDRAVAPVSDVRGDYSLSYWKGSHDSEVYTIFTGNGNAPSTIFGIPTKKVLGVEDATLPDGSGVTTISYPDGTRTVSTVSTNGNTTVTEIVTYGFDGSKVGSVRITVTVTPGESGSATIKTETERFGPDGKSLGTSSEVTIEVGYGSSAPRLDASSIREIIGSLADGDAITVTPSGESTSGFDVVITSDAFDAAGSRDILIQGPAGSIRISSGSFGQDQKTGGVTLFLQRADISKMTSSQQNAVQGLVVYEIGADSGSSIHQLADKVVVTLPYVPTDGMTGDMVSVFYVDESGNLHQMDTKYDRETNTLSFETDHFSYFTVAKALVEDEDSDSTVMLGAIAVLAIVIIAIAAVFIVRSRRTA